MEPGTILIEGKRHYFWICLYEFLGSVIFLLGINFASGNALIIGMSFFIASVLTGKVNGAHYNMSVTIAVYIIERKWLKNIRIALIIIIADLLGATVGILLAIALKNGDSLFVLKPKSQLSPLWQVFI